jgi:hypothetical protein
MRELISVPDLEEETIFNYKKRNELKNAYHKHLKHFLDDFKAQTRQYAKR